MKKKITALVLTIVMVFSLTGCLYEKLEVTMNEDGSGTVYAYMQIDKEAIDMLQQMDEDLEESAEDGTEVTTSGDMDMEEFEIRVIDGKEYYVAEETQDFSTVEELTAIFKSSDSYEDIYITTDTISFKTDTEETAAEEIEMEGDAEMDLSDSIKIEFSFTMPAPIVYTTGTLSEDGYTATYSTATESDSSFLDVFVTTSEEEAGFEKIRHGVENTKITAKTTLTSKGKIKLTWKKSGNYHMDYYEVYRSTKKSSGYGKKPYYTTSTGKKTTYTNTKVKSGTRYYYKVRGVRIVDGEKIYTEYSNKANRTAK